MMTNNTLLNLIERKRQELYELARKYGLSDLRVLQKSQELDRILNKY